MLMRCLRLFLLLFTLQLSAAAPSLKVGVICALPKELGTLSDEMSPPVQTRTVGLRNYISGLLWGVDTVIATSRVGKVAAATTATHLIETEGVELVVFLGVAGAIDQRLHQGDVVIGERFVQYDIDSRPIIPQYTIPLLNVIEVEADRSLVERGREAAEEYLHQHQVYSGLIGTADRFISSPSDRESLRDVFPNLLAVDMEGGAVAQVCYEHSVPFVVIRTISDGCDQQAATDCMAFMQKVAPIYTREILYHFFRKIN